MSGWLTKTQKKQLYKLLLALAVAGIGYLVRHQQSLSSVLGQISPGYYLVTEFADGDTISVDMAGKTERIRMIGVDTPETQDPRKAVQCFGKAASEHTKQLIGAQPVRLEADPTSTNRDRYNRLLRYVYLQDGTLIQARLIKDGYGFAYTSFPFTKAHEFKALETEARTNNRGLWGSCSPQLNSNGGFTSNDQAQ